MKKSVFLLAVFIALTASPAFALYTEFKAIAVEYDNGEKTESKVWITNSKSRRDFKAGKEIVITRNDLKRNWYIYPEIRCYVETPSLGTYANFDIPPESANTGDLKRKFLCYEERDGFRMKKFLVTVKYRNMPGEDKYYEWRRNDFPVPVRTESLDGSSWTEYRNISRGPINQDLFNKPGSYKLVAAEEAERLLDEFEEKEQKRQLKRTKKHKEPSRLPQKQQSTDQEDMPLVETDTLLKLLEGK